MENTFFGLVLFLIVYGFLIWITDGGNIGFDGAKALGEDSPATTKVSFGEINNANEVVDSSERDKPIEQQLKDILWDDEVEQTIPNDNKTIPVVTEEAVTQLNYRQARKVAGKLGIRRKVNGKDANKAWLIAQIKAKVRNSAAEVKIAFDEVINAA